MSAPVTVTVRRKVKPGRETDYEAWLNRMVEAVGRNFEGYLGAEFHRPGADGAYRSVFRFDSIEHLEAFERSHLRAKMLADGADLFAADTAWERMTGLEFWFDPPQGTKVALPSPHRIALVLIGVVFCLVMALNLLLGPFMTGWPLAARLFVTVFIQVELMTYVIMPWLTPRIARFIYPKSQTL